MSTTTAPLDFELPNVGAGPDTFSPADADAEYLVLLLQRDYYCKKCRRQVQSAKRRYDEFQDANAEVVSVLPEPTDRTKKWQTSYDLPFPLLADEGKEVGDAMDQPERFGVLGSLHDLVGRMPEALVLDVETGEVLFDHAGDSPGDRPDIDELLAAIPSA
ncbi:peroxiredoxin [Halogeometricum borinquense DSM 11551]|uniref:Peroxiredoxin n=2 Tax=Halogeometricum borinquense TaxID=60847 RepID=E4NRJ2_HALBP|nr:redoxin domain-containing protein [Halogeometricum borinquense]ADQ65668.1 Peroxiredoxin [Halogeometricum borinquense DSM 11551]ELY26998.1 peroxiredoxin [Halogeometricum borinquense DSM 11551]RYJ15140.1 redoxin domain-containing protein [Halogeometricum borinquense]